MGEGRVARGGLGSAARILPVRARRVSRPTIGRLADALCIPRITCSGDAIRSPCL